MTSKTLEDILAELANALTPMDCAIEELDIPGTSAWALVTAREAYARSARLLQEAQAVLEAEKPLPTDREGLEALLWFKGWRLTRWIAVDDAPQVWVKADAEEDPRGMTVSVWWGPNGRAEHIYRGSAKISTLGGVL